jgi:Predicted membrane protein
MIIAKYIMVVLIGYLLGSIPFGLLISRRSAKTDVRQIGSGKTGATNVLRTAGKKAAALVLILDLSKGILAVVIYRVTGQDYFTVPHPTDGSNQAGYGQGSHCRQTQCRQVNAAKRHAG